MNGSTAQGNSMKFGMEVVLVVGKVCNTVLWLYHSSCDCIKQNKSKYGAKVKMADHHTSQSYSVLDAQPLIYSKLILKLMISAKPPKRFV